MEMAQLLDLKVGGGLGEESIRRINVEIKRRFAADDQKRRNYPKVDVAKAAESLTRLLDTMAVTKLLESIGANTSGVTVLIVPGNPNVKKRPRFGRGRAYTDKTAKENEEEMKANMARVFPEKLTGPLASACIFYRADRRVVDLDNLLKFVNDCANGVCFHDDNQVVRSVEALELDSANPRTIVAFAPYTLSTMSRKGKGWQG